MRLPPIVYVPGWGCDADQYAECLSALGPDGAAQVVVDLAGAGTLRAMAERVAAGLPADECDLVGVSMGGWVAQRVAADHASRVRRLVVGSTWAPRPAAFLAAAQPFVDLVAGGSWGAELRPLVLPGFSPALHDGPLPDRLVAMMERLGPAAVLAQWDAMSRDADVAAAHAAIRAPTLVLAGDGDALFPVGGQRAIAHSLVAEGRVTVGFELIENSNHNVPWEQPERFVAAVRRWLREPRPHGLDSLTLAA